MSITTTTTVTPRLVVAGADRAIAFYRETLGAELIERYDDAQGHVIHAALSIDGCIIAVTDERPDYGNLAPPSLGGTPILLNLVVDDVDGVARKMLAGGADIVFPVADQYYGHRSGRLRDPFGHLWIIATMIESLTAEEITARMQAS